MKVMNTEDLSAEGLAKAGMPAELIAFLSALGAIEVTSVSITASELSPPDVCGCPPGVCLGDQFSDALDRADEVMAGYYGEVEAEDEEDDDDELEVHFEPYFELGDEPVLDPEDKVEAVAQLGRIVENLTVLADAHATLLKKLVA
ncbi:hypothetical protein [Bradyrhizobium sp. th.b2]|uniref:hypothetical protein n=1 Tax=Bradyrhizobium sp. th-b2 TaxID=172088 RepID=UPI0003F9F1E6|nr:hypothetical protein [Bradyrhizobium sp. th.b2]